MTRWSSRERSRSRSGKAASTAWGSAAYHGLRFGRDGGWLSDVTLPADFQPLEIGADYVLAVTRDADDVETVVLHQLGGG